MTGSDSKTQRLIDLRDELKEILRAIDSGQTTFLSIEIDRMRNRLNDLNVHIAALLSGKPD